MSLSEIAVMPGGKCILQLQGLYPFYSDKYDITKHPKYKALSDHDKKNAFDPERYLSRLRRSTAVFKASDMPSGELDFLTEILVEGQEFEFDFSSYKSKNYVVSGRIKIKEQDLLVKPRRGIVNSPKTEAWMCTHPKYWKILCGLESADTKTNIKIMGMLVRAGLYELSEMMCRRIDVLISPASANELERLMLDTSTNED